MIEEPGIPAFESDDPFADPPTDDERVMLAGRWDLIKPALDALTGGKRTKQLRKEGEDLSAMPPSADEQEALNQTFDQMARETEQEFGQPGIVTVTPEHITRMADEIYSGGRTQTRNLNFDYMDAPDAAKSFINAVAEQHEGFIDQRRGVRSREQTARAATSRKVVSELADLVGGKPGTAWNAEQLVAGRKVVLRLATEISELAKTVNVTGGSPEERAKLVQLHRSLSAVQRAVQGGVAEAGRALNSMQQVVDPAFPKERMVQFETIINGAGGNENVEKMAAMYAKADGAKEINKTAAVLRESYDKGIRTVQEVWINSILSGVQTHVVNFLGNTIVQMYETGVVKPVAGGVGMVRQAIQGAISDKVDERIYLSEVPPEVIGKTQGLIDTFVAMAQDKMDYVKTLDAEQKVENPKFRAISAENYGIRPNTAAATAVDVAGEIVRIPGTMLSVSDDMFKSIVYRGEINSLAVRQGMSEGLEGAALQERVYGLMQNPTAEMHMMAKAESDKLTFTSQLDRESGFISWFGKMVQEGSEKYPVLKFFTPFIRTPANIANYMLQNSITAPLTKQWRLDIQAGGIARDKAIARLGIALGSTWSVWQMAESGQITGQGPKDWKLRRQLEETGWKPNSVLIDGVYYGYNRLDPIGGMMGFIADSADLIRYSESAQESELLVSAMVGGLLQNFASKTYMQGFNDLVGMLNGGPQVLSSIKQWAKSTSTGLIPFSGLLRTFRKADDEVIRDTRNRNDFLQSIRNAMANTVPGYSDTLPARLDWKGEVQTLQGNVIWRSMSPVQHSALTGDKVSLDLVDNSVVVPEPSYIVTFVPNSRFNLLEIDPSGELYSKYLELVGKSRYKAVKQAIKIANKKKATRVSGVDTPRSELLTKAVALGKKQGQSEFLRYYRQTQKNNPTWPEITKSQYKRALELNRQLVEMGQPQEGPITFTNIGQGGLVPEETKETLMPEF